MAALTSAQVREIQAAACTGSETLSEIAFRFCITSEHAGKICRGLPYRRKPLIRSYSPRGTHAETVFGAIDRVGHDEDFEPRATQDFHPTDAPSGSHEKISVLRRRVELGQPLWHRLDRVDFAGLGVGNRGTSEFIGGVGNIKECKIPMSGKGLSQ